MKTFIGCTSTRRSLGPTTEAKKGGWLLGDILPFFLLRGLHEELVTYAKFSVGYGFSSIGIPPIK